MSDKPPHPSISFGDEKLNKEMADHVSRITTPIFEKALKETKKNHVSVGGGGKKKDYSYAFYNPHNARYYFNFNKINFNHKGVGGVGIRKALSVINTSEYCSKDFMGCRIVVKKNLIEITNQINKDRLFKIDGNADNRRLQVAETVATLEHECMEVLHKFINYYGGNSNYKCVKYWIPDNKILHDKIVDSIPIKQTFRNEVVKKVYNENPSNVEYSDPAFAANALRNMGLNDYVPEIVSELSKLNLLVTKGVNPLRYLKSTIKQAEDCFREDIKEVIMFLSKDQKAELSGFLFELNKYEMQHGGVGI